MAANRSSPPVSPEGIARLTPDGPVEGFAADGLVSVTRSRRRRARRFTRNRVPSQPATFEYEISWLNEDGDPFLFDGGVGDLSGPVIHGLREGRVVLYGETFTVRWLDDSEFVEANRVMGGPF